MDIKTIIEVGTLACAVLTVFTVIFNGFQNYRTTEAARRAAERAEERATESLHRSEANATMLSKVATTVQLNGHLEKYRQIVRAEAESRIREAELRAERAFVAGREAERSAEPLATAASVEEVKQIVAEKAAAVQAMKP